MPRQSTVTAVLCALAGAAGPLPVPEIAAATGLPRGTVLNCLHALLAEDRAQAAPRPGRKGWLWQAGPSPAGAAEALVPAAARPPHLVLADAIEAAIRSGELRPGARIPPGRALAREHGVTDGTVHRARRLLAERGLVRADGRGTFVTLAGKWRPATGAGTAQDPR